MTQPAEPSAPVHPVIAAMRRAPRVNVLTPEQRAELDQAVEDIQAGRVKLIPHEELEAWREAHADEIAALGPLDE
jgi:hypothetical protein